MPRHRGFSLDRFTFGIPLELIERYFAKSQPQGEAQPSFGSMDAMKEWLDAPENAETAGAVLEEWHRINDICVHGGRHLFRAYERSRVPCDAERAPEELALRLFLDDRPNFDYAWSHYILQSGQARMSQYRFPAGDLEFSGEDERAFERFLKDMFHQQKMGTNCKVQVSRDASGVIVLVSRGAYLRTFMRWKGTEVTFETFRPAVEDVMIYEPKAQRLSVRPGHKRDRDLYVRAVSRFLAHDQELGERAMNEPMFDLSPIRDGRFNYKGDGAIRRVVLREAELDLSSLGKSVVVIKGDDVVRTLRDDLPQLSLQLGELRRVRLLFEIRADPGGRAYPVAFEIAPPGFSDFAVKAHAEHIDRYLRQQKVKLV